MTEPTDDAPTTDADSTTEDAPQGDDNPDSGRDETNHNEATNAPPDGETLAAMTHPDREPDVDEETVVRHVADRLRHENARLNHDTYNGQSELIGDTVRASVRLNDAADEYQILPDTAIVHTDATDHDAEVVLLEGESALHAYCLARTTEHDERAREAVREQLRVNDSPRV